MIDFQEKAAAELFRNNLISDNQLKEIKEYRLLNIFSLHNELRFLLYLSVLLFTTGTGVLIYKNIDSIGHSIILIFILMLIVSCFYFSFKNYVGFAKTEVLFKNSVFDYVVLLGTILSCIFVGYLQFQYQIFGKSLGNGTLVACAIAFVVAYYFDNKSSLSIGITALAAFVGITITPKTLLQNEIYSNSALANYGLILGILLVLWTIYCSKTNLKKHFNIVLLTFALHLCSICIIAGLLANFQVASYWFLYVPILVASVYYFNKVSQQTGMVSIFIFNFIYGYVGFNISIGILFSYVDNWSDIWILPLFLFPVYFVFSIIFFIKATKNFNKTNHDSIQ